MESWVKALLQAPAVLNQDIASAELDQVPLEVIIDRLPMADRVRFFLYLAEHPLPEQVPHGSYEAALDIVGKAIPVNRHDVLKMMFESAMGKPVLRATATLPAETTDGFQTPKEIAYQAQLAQAVSHSLPQALNLTPEDFIKTRLDDKEQGKLLAYLHVRQLGATMTIRKADSLLRKNMRLSRESWESFKSSCIELTNCPDGLALRTSQMTDRIVCREILDLAPEQIANLSDNAALNFLIALGLSGSPNSEIFQKAQRHLYVNLNPPQALVARRERQIDDALEHFSRMSDEELRKWQEAKKTWGNKSTADKEAFLSAYIAVFGEIIGIPKAPELKVISSKEAKQQSKQHTNGFFTAWTRNEEGQLLFQNKVYLVDGADEKGNPLSLNTTMRASITTSGHETLHSDDEQTNIRSSSSEDYQCYAALFEEGEKPAQFEEGSPMHNTGAIIFFSQNGRTTYVDGKKDWWLYYNQPVEKCVWLFQNQFAAAINGKLVFTQVEAGERDLNKEILNLFKETEKVLSRRNAATHDSKDLTQFFSNNPCYSYGVPPPTGEGLATDTPSLYDPKVFPLLGSRAQALEHLKSSFKKLEAPEATAKDFLTYYHDTSYFLAQMPNEIWSLRKNLINSGKDIAGLDLLAFKTRELAEDLSDYCFVIERSEQLPTRKAARNSAPNIAPK